MTAPPFTQAFFRAPADADRPRPALGRAVAILACLALAACAAPGGPAGRTTGNGPAPAATKPGHPAATATPTPTAMPASLPPAQRPGSPPPVDPARLKGLGTAHVRELLGEPGMLRREPPAEVWQYHGLGCVVDVFLYEDNGAQRVTYVQVRSLDDGSPRLGDAECLSRLMRKKGPEG